MTTEVLRNMLYGGSPALRGLGYVVMDEVHYLSDRFRGAVWEEVIIHLPADVRLVSLSATVSNAEEFADWLVTVRGDTAVIVEEHRPVPLWQHVMVGRRLLDLFVDPGDGRRRVNPELVRLARDAGRAVVPRPRRPGRGGRRRGAGGGRDRAEVVEPARPRGPAARDHLHLQPGRLRRRGRGSASAPGLRLNTPEERAEVRAGSSRSAPRDLPDERPAGARLLGVARRPASAGSPPTTPGCCRPSRRSSRSCSPAAWSRRSSPPRRSRSASTCRPAPWSSRSSCKWNGETHADITPGEYTQLTGRAGRRGIDVEGHAVVLWQPGVDPERVAGLASTRTYPLRSSFRPSYNMAVNLVGQVGRRARPHPAGDARSRSSRPTARSSGSPARCSATRRRCRATREAMTCHLGDFAEYAALRAARSRPRGDAGPGSAATRRGEAAASLEQLRPGDVIPVPTGRRAGLAVVARPRRRACTDGPRPTVLTADRQVKRLTVADFPVPVDAAGAGAAAQVVQRRARRRPAATWPPRCATSTCPTPPRPRRGRSAAADDTELARLRRELRAPPRPRLRRARGPPAVGGALDPAAPRHRRASSGGWRTAPTSLARTFDRVCGVLRRAGLPRRRRGHRRRAAAGPRLHRVRPARRGVPARRRLGGPVAPRARRRRVGAGLRVPARRRGAARRLPGGAVREALRETGRLWARLHDLEPEHRLGFLREPDPRLRLGGAAMGVRATGLDRVLDDDLAAGDFVRWTSS